MNRKISIVAAHYNRQALLDKTLESIHASANKDYELIIVDDASAEPLVCDEAKIIRVDRKDKWYTCSSVAFNRGFREATGDIIIIQNPECYHVGDVLSYVREHIRNNQYFSFACYAISSKETQDFHNGIMPIINNQRFEDGNGWYNHTEYRPVGYHFCSAIMRKDLDRIGGFDERYSRGVAFDDDDLIRYIKGSKMDVSIINKPYVIHQFHTHFEMDKPSAWRPYHDRNLALFNGGLNFNIPKDYSRNVILYPDDEYPWGKIIVNYERYYTSYTKKEEQRIPRNLHMLWLEGELPLAYIKLIDKWIELHPAWDIKIWTKDDLDSIGLTNPKSYKFEILYRYGGVFVDMDFKPIKPLDDLLYLDFFGGGRDINAKSFKPLLLDGIIGCAPQSKFLKSVIEGIAGYDYSYLTKKYIDYIQDTPDKTVLFPDAFFYPMPSSFCDEIKEDNNANESRIQTYIKPQTYCVHLWHENWRPPMPQIPVIKSSAESKTERKKHIMDSPIQRRISKKKYLRRRYGDRYNSR
jgi:glycosyltransferase involved in cell wall biosynthesis